MHEVEDGPVDTTRRPGDDLLDVARVLLLLQGAILVATTIDALMWAGIFPGASGWPALISGLSATLVLVGRSRLRADRRWARRLVDLVEGLILFTGAVDVAIGLALAHALPPLVALLTQVVLPIGVTALLRRSARQPRAAATSSHGRSVLDGAA
jgi:hypothetical protein